MDEPTSLPIFIGHHSDVHMGDPGGAGEEFVYGPRAGHPWRRAWWTVEARDALLKEPFVHRDGVLQVPSRPGLGFEINRKALRRWGKRFFVMGRKRLVFFSLRHRGIAASKEINRVRSERLAREGETADT